jgi:hypothetical protein
MPRANDATIDRAIRRDRSLLHPDADLTSLTSLTPTALPNDVQIVHVASIEARSESFRIGDENLIVVDKVQASWIRALRLALPPAHSDAWPLFILYHYLLVRLVSAGLPSEASALSHRLRRETRNVSRDRTFETGASVAETAGIERFILGHELGHVAYKSGGTEVATLMNTVYECTDDLTRLLRVTFGGDRSLLTEEEQNPRYEDIVQSMKDYINRFVFHEQALMSARSWRARTALPPLPTSSSAWTSVKRHSAIYMRLSFASSKRAGIALARRPSPANGGSISTQCSHWPRWTA